MCENGSENAPPKQMFETLKLVFGENSTNLFLLNLISILNVLVWMEYRNLTKRPKNFASYRKVFTNYKKTNHSTKMYISNDLVPHSETSENNLSKLINWIMWMFWTHFCLIESLWMSMAIDSEDIILFIMAILCW